MFKNYVKIALRNLRNRLGYTFINISGLAIGIASCLLISIYVINELSYDRFNSKARQIYRIKQTTIASSKEKPDAQTPFLVGSTVEREYPQLIKTSVRFYDRGNEATSFLDRDREISMRTEGFYFTDSTFFDVFSARLIRGNPDNALDNPLSLVISEELANKYYPDENPIGRTLSYNGIRSMAMTITGVMEEWPEESHMNLKALASFSSLKTLFSRNPDYMDNWWINPVWTYVELKDPGAVAALQDQLPNFVEKYYTNTNRPDGESIELGLQPLTDIHLYSNLENEINPNGSIFYVNLFSAVAILILLIACVNFMNLATARSVERGREVGMRKVLGADRWQLIKQFMGESFLMSFFAVVFAVLLAYLFLPVFNEFAGKELSFNIFTDPFMLTSLAVLVILVGIIAGIYPSLFLSGFRPAAVLKGEATKGEKGVLFRKGLVVFQFGLSVLLIIGTIIVYLQLQHMQNKELGFDEEQVIILPMSQNLIAWEYDQFKEQALGNPSIKTVTGISKILGSEEEHNWQVFPVNTPQGEEESTQFLNANYDFLETFGIELIAGRAFSKDYQTDKEEAIYINRAMAYKLEHDDPEEALGEQFRYETTLSDTESEIYTVVGVVENFNYSSIKKEVEPLVIRLATGTRNVLTRLDHAAIKVAPGGISDALTHLEKVWKEINFVDPFEYSFQDEELDKVYASEMRMSKVAGAFTILCILVACLGLFGLASFTASKRTKEIGIRKTLGASLGGILMLLSREYVKLILVANIIAWPVIYLLMNQWLQDFPYRINLGWNLLAVFGATGIASVLICLLTVSYQSMKAALINPVDSIRQE